MDETAIDGKDNIQKILCTPDWSDKAPRADADTNAGKNLTFIATKSASDKIIPPFLVDGVVVMKSSSILCRNLKIRTIFYEDWNRFLKQTDVMKMSGLE